MIGKEWWNKGKKFWFFRIHTVLEVAKDSSARLKWFPPILHLNLVRITLKRFCITSKTVFVHTVGISKYSFVWFSSKSAQKNHLLLHETVDIILFIYYSLLKTTDIKSVVWKFTNNFIMNYKDSCNCKNRKYV
jgi:hypothetical protein